MNILLISSSLPPNFDSQTIRNYHFIKGLVQNGAKVDAISVGRSSYKVEEDYFKDLISNFTVTEEPLIIDLSHRIKNQKLKNVFLTLTTYFVAPDLYKGWDKIIVDLYNNQLVNRKYDLIISTSGSYVAHIAASRIAKISSTKLLVDLGDPWADNPIWPESMWHKRIINSKLEMQVLKKCTLVTTNNRTTEHYRKKYPDIDIFTVPMGYSSSSQPKELANIIAKKTIKISHIGVAYKKSRNLIPLIHAVSNFPDFELEIVGPHSLSFEKFVIENRIKNVSFKNKVSYKEALKLSNEADISVVVGNTGGLQVPGKLYAALGLPKPVLYLQQEKEDASLDVISTLDGFLVVDNNFYDITNTLELLQSNYEEYQKLSYSRIQSEQVLEFDWNQIGRKFYEICNRSI